MELARLDLNLLLVFHHLLREKRVSAVATVLGMSQPAVSRALARLRLLYDDPLLIRTPQGMEPTARAQALLLPLREILHDIEQTFSQPEQHDPSQFEGVLRIGAHTYVEYVMMPSLLGRLQQQCVGCAVVAFDGAGGDEVHQPATATTSLVTCTGDLRSLPVGSVSDPSSPRPNWPSLL